MTYSSCCFSATPVSQTRDIMEEVARHSSGLMPDYLWFVRIEKQYAGKGLLSKGRDWKKVCRNSPVVLYRHEVGH